MTTHELAVQHVTNTEEWRVDHGMEAYSKEKRADLVKIQEWVLNATRAHQKQILSIVNGVTK